MDSVRDQPRVGPRSVQGQFKVIPGSDQGQRGSIQGQPKLSPGSAQGHPGVSSRSTHSGDSRFRHVSDHIHVRNKGSKYLGITAYYMELKYSIDISLEPLISLRLVTESSDNLALTNRISINIPNI